MNCHESEPPPMLLCHCDHVRYQFPYFTSSPPARIDFKSIRKFTALNFNCNHLEKERGKEKDRQNMMDEQ